MISKVYRITYQKSRKIYADESTSFEVFFTNSVIDMYMVHDNVLAIMDHVASVRQRFLVVYQSLRVAELVSQFIT